MSYRQQAEGDKSNLVRKVLPGRASAHAETIPSARPACRRNHFRSSFGAGIRLRCAHPPDDVRHCREITGQIWPGLNDRTPARSSAVSTCQRWRLFSGSGFASCGSCAPKASRWGLNACVVACSRQGLRPVCKRPKRVTTDSVHSQPMAPNLLERYVEQTRTSLYRTHRY